MAKYQFLLAFLFVTIVTISAMAIDDSNSKDSIQEESNDLYWSCQHGGDAACTGSCAVQRHFKGGYCKNGVCYCRQ